jgi:hypothetical protein
MTSVDNYHLVQIFVLVLVAFLIVRSIKNNWFSNPTDKNNKKSKEIDSEYHNDFSKVPAGEPDGLIHPPRSIGWGHGVGDKTMYEDLERVGLIEDDIDLNEEDKKKKLDS